MDQTAPGQPSEPAGAESTNEPNQPDAGISPDAAIGPDATHEPDAAIGPGELVLRRAQVITTRPASLARRRLRSAVVAARRLAGNPAVVASATAIGAIAAREGLALARRLAVREVDRPMAQAPVLVVVNVVYSVHHTVHEHTVRHEWMSPAPPIAPPSSR